MAEGGGVPGRGWASAAARRGAGAARAARRRAGGTARSPPAPLPGLFERCLPLPRLVLLPTPCCHVLTKILYGLRSEVKTFRLSLKLEYQQAIEDMKLIISVRNTLVIVLTGRTRS